MIDIIRNIKLELKKNGDKKIQESSQRFFKEKIVAYGIKSQTVAKIANEYFKQLKGKPKSKIFKLCGELWKSEFMEESFIACEWAYALRKDFKPEDFKLFESWINSYVSNWAECDTFCNHTVGSFVMMYPEFISYLKKWAVSGNQWMRRAAAVSLIIPARKGMFLEDIFILAKILLKDKEDLVQKGYGWMLKAASQAHQKEVFEFVMKNKVSMPRTALRYAIEKMPPELRVEAMKK